VADIYTASADAVALAAATAKTVLQIAAPATIRGRVRELQISLDGVTAANPPGLVELLTQSTAGTMTAVTPAPHDPAAPASLVTAAKNATAEPTAGTVIKAWRLTPVGGVLVLPFGFEEERPVLAASGRIGVRCTFSAIVNVNASLTFLA
jgi:hypothetical protein